MKMPLDWHRQCFANFTRTVEGRRNELASLAASIERDERRLAFYGEQIASAEKKKLDGFDDERFMVKRKT